MQHKSIFAQTGRATYITLMTVQSQGGTTNETKCNYCPPPIWKQNKPPCTPIWVYEHRDENKPSSRHHSALQLAFLSLFRSVFGLFITIPISWWLTHHSVPDIYELIKKKSRELQEVLSYWHSNSIPPKLSTQFAELLSQKRSEPNKINAPQPPATPVSPFHWKTMYFAFWSFWSALKTENNTPVLSLSLSLTHSLRLSPVYILLIQGDFHTSLGL